LQKNLGQEKGNGRKEKTGWGGCRRDSAKHFPGFLAIEQDEPTGTQEERLWKKKKRPGGCKMGIFVHLSVPDLHRPRKKRSQYVKKGGGGHRKKIQSLFLCGKFEEVPSCCILPWGKPVSFYAKGGSKGEELLGGFSPWKMLKKNLFKRR